MIISGYSPNSYVDYPGNIAAVIFLANCSLRCCYCHNLPMLDGVYDELKYDEVLTKIEKNKLFLDGVVITGGEPTMNSKNELLKLINDIKSLGLLVKLDTCGSNSKVLKELIPHLDYVAMDIKAPLEKYSKITPVNDNLLQNIKDSIEIVKTAKDYEFRTTIAPEITNRDIEEIAKMISGSKAYYIQQYNATESYQKKSYSPDYVRLCKEMAEVYLPTYIRGL